jgi:hypothetical protein
VTGDLDVRQGPVELVAARAKLREGDSETRTATGPRTNASVSDPGPNAGVSVRAGK